MAERHDAEEVVRQAATDAEADETETAEDH